MKNLLTVVVGSALLTLSLGGVAHSAVLGTEEFSTAGGSADILKDYQLKLTIGSASDRFPSNAPLFDGTKVTPDDVGRTFTVNEATDTNFNKFVSFLTDGKPDGIALATGDGSLSISGNLFGGKPDLAGSKINSISLRINSFALDTPGINPNGDSNWTDESFNATLSIEGEPITQNTATSVPEPSSMLGVLIFGAFGTGLALKRKLQLKALGVSVK